MIGVRAATGLLLPMAFAMKALDGRRKHPPGASVEREEAAFPPPGPRPSRRTLRQLVADGADLRSLDLRRAPMKRFALDGHDLTGLDLTGADLRGAQLTEADLSGTVLDHADLHGANLRGATLLGTSVIETDLVGADLRGADLTGCRQLIMANLKDARHDRTTRWPTGFRPDPVGGRVAL